MKYRTEISLALSLGHVWALLADPAEAVRWRRDLVSFCFGDIPPTVGTTVEFSVREASQTQAFAGEVVVWEQPRRMGWRYHGGGMADGMWVREEYALAPQGDGTVVTLSASLEDGPVPLRVRLMRPFLNWTGRKLAERRLTALRKHANGGG